MKKLFYSALTALLVILLLPTACKKSENNARVPLPDVSTFAILSASPFAAGTSSTVNVYSTSLGSGTFKVYFDLTGSNTITSQSATLVINNNYGSFKTPDIPNPGETFLTLNSITNVNGGGTRFITNNRYTISDSTGLMTAIIDTTTSFLATDVLATLDGHRLTIRGVASEPYNNVMTLIIDSFTHVNGIINFASNIVPEIASARYQIPGGGLVSATGTINIMTISPYLSGTYSFTAMDSTHVTNGSFSVPTPQ